MFDEAEDDREEAIQIFEERVGQRKREQPLNRDPQRKRNRKERTGVTSSDLILNTIILKFLYYISCPHGRNFVSSDLFWDIHRCSLLALCDCESSLSPI
ncbi:hypothetical protein BDV32DRAFT_52172 [Aspergillus pseudonomiae]|nr:hypothetical protein BDV32DRAFT_52172 [Aspergillus pseudonomiae]